MFGILSLQVYVYLISYRNDSRLQRGFVRAAILYTLSLELIASSGPRYLAVGFGTYGSDIGNGIPLHGHKLCQPPRAGVCSLVCIIA